MVKSKMISNFTIGITRSQGPFWYTSQRIKLFNLYITEDLSKESNIWYNLVSMEPGGARCLDYKYMDANSAKLLSNNSHWSKVCHVTSLPLDFIGSAQIKTVHD